MDMIYADANFQDIGVLQDYSFDECYGNDDNTFECKVQKYNHVCREDFILYVEFTEYGGIVDRIESDTKSGEIAYIGRTWHGVLNSFVIEPPKGNIYRTYSGEANNVLRQIINDIGMSSLFVVSTNNSNISILNYRVRYEKAYDVIREMLFAYQGKVVMYYSNGKVYMEAVISANYAVDEEFDSSQVPFKVGMTFNNCNHLICLGTGEGNNRAVIHLYATDSDVDGDGIADIQPYIKLDAVTNPSGNPFANAWYEKSGNLYVVSTDTSVVSGKTYYKQRTPYQDSDYILDKSQQVMFGKNEIAQVYDASNSEIITNYLLQRTKPNDWKGTYYQKYYERSVDEDGKEKFSLFKQTYKDEYTLLKSKPKGWDGEAYKEYYMWDSEADPQYYVRDPNNGNWIQCDSTTSGAVLKAGKFVGVRALTRQDHPERLTYQYAGDAIPADWTIEHYTDFFQPTGIAGEYQRVPQQTETWYGNGNVKSVNKDHTITAEPPDWTWAWSSYYKRRKNNLNQWEYFSVEGVQHFHYKQVNKKPTKWTSEWGSYYFKRNVTYTSGKKKVTYAIYDTVQDGVNMGLIKLQKNKTYPKFKKKTFYIKIQDPDTAPSFTQVKDNEGGVFAQYSSVILPNYEINRYYREIFNEVPDWTDPNTTYWEKLDSIEQIPIFDPNAVYYAVEDRYKMLAEAGYKKLLELNDTSSLDINLELDSTYDVGDIVGSIDETTGIAVNRTILRKIIKIKKDIVSVEYEVNDYV